MESFNEFQEGFRLKLDRLALNERHIVLNHPRDLGVILGHILGLLGALTVPKVPLERRKNRRSHAENRHDHREAVIRPGRPDLRDRTHTGDAGKDQKRNAYDVVAKLHTHTVEPKSQTALFAVQGNGPDVVRQCIFGVLFPKGVKINDFVHLVS
jgi:hypothetical protein